ncbi:MAG: hypothetical protein ABEJ28_05005 [Salinigranum sp.]
MIVVATEDFELYHEVVAELRSRGVEFTTIEPGDPIPDRARVVITAPDDEVDTEGRARVTAAADESRRAVEEALSLVRDGGGRVVVGVDPGRRPGIAVLTGDTVVAAFHVPLADAVDVIREEIEGAEDPLVRVGDGARLQGAQIVNELGDVAVELVDETGTTPSLGTGARGMGDVLAAVNIAHIAGERVDGRQIEPTKGEIQVIKTRSRERSPTNRTITEALARRVARGDLTLEEALREHETEG